MDILTGFFDGRVRFTRTLSFVLGSAFLLMLFPLAASSEATGRDMVSFRTVEVGSPGNPSVAIVPFTDAIYATCADTPAGTDDCQTIGDVDYRYGIGQLEITVGQWVKFLNTTDPNGKNKHRLYEKNQSPSVWPGYGQVKKVKSKPGRHYRVASGAWATKPYAFATFLSAARLANSLYNGKLISKKKRAGDGFKYVDYTVKLSKTTERGMYNMRNKSATRAHKTGFVVPSQDEWTKAAYFDPDGGGTMSYWKYPTNAGVFGDGDATAPNPTTLNNNNGNVTNSADQPVASFHESGLAAPTWCPAIAQTSSGCSTTNPFDMSSSTYAKVFQATVGTVGSARTFSPWGTLDQGGNAVEWTDTITPPPFGLEGKGRVWRRLHGGISNAPAYQMWPSAVGLQPQDNFFYARTYPWLGIRLGVIGNLKVKN